MCPLSLFCSATFVHPSSSHPCYPPPHASILYLVHLTTYSHTPMSICPPPICASTHLSLHPTNIWPSFHLSNQHLPIHPFNHPPFHHLPVQPVSIHPSTNIPSFHSPIHSSIQTTNTYLSTDPSVHTANVYSFTHSSFHSPTHPPDPPALSSLCLISPQRKLVQVGTMPSQWEDQTTPQKAVLALR